MTLAQHYVVQRFLPISRNPANCWEGMKTGYIHGTTATEISAKLRTMTAQYIRYCRNQCREYGVRPPRMRLVVQAPFRLN